MIIENDIANALKLKCLFLDFDGVLSNNFVYTNSKGEEFIQSSKSDSIYVNLFFKAKIKLVVVSSEKNNSVKMRCKKMKLESYSGIENKLFFIKDYLKKKKLNIFECGYVGNDLNDYHVMEIFKYRITTSDANPIIKKISNIKLKSKGGEFVLREIFEKYLKLNSLNYL